MSEELIIEKVDNISKKLDSLCMKVDSLTNPRDGVIPKIQQFQASCQRKNFKWIWLIVIPLGLANVGVAAAALAAVFRYTGGG